MALEPKIYLQRIAFENGKETIGEKVDIFEKWDNIKYKSATGLQDYGEQRVYVEEFPESNKASVVVSGVRKQTDITLTLLFFSSEDTDNETEAYSSADKTYHEFMSLLSGDKFVYSDNLRNRKAVVYLNGKPDIKNDSLYGIVYKEVVFKFKNVYGHTFAEGEDIK